ncbi:hypothetical protein Dfer_2000 [Dyadobacter fermentans DSM 18053]|uniref:Uncharacterized protein n=1 Tax=Dyadobacter fermentans (strain ATCC 700827 / DSM 18053 / CIP 107007 / KCTC 52180 / NS114) TaxID=471854 RepID=C6VW91_DYAFD|nr:hypothetical protein Dfer_2000 [Dyadobacter fermentans DSM 18053]
MNCITPATSVPVAAYRFVFAKTLKKDLFYTIFNYASTK